MNWAREYNKPIFLDANGRLVTLGEAKEKMQRFGALTENLRGLSAGVSAFASRGMTKVAEATHDQVKQLVIGRLKSEQDRRFRLMDGREFTGDQAAQAVATGTKEGQYFLRLEKRAIELVETALAKGEVK